MRLENDTGGGQPPLAGPPDIFDCTGDLYFDVLDHIEPIYTGAGRRAFRVDNLSYSWDSIPSGHLSVLAVAGDRLWLTSPVMYNAAQRLVAWLGEVGDCDLRVTAPGLLRELCENVLRPKPLVEGLYKEAGGFLWPAHDKLAAALILNEAARHTIDQALQGVTGFRTCVQAGGNVGVFPIRLAEAFRTVITWEVDPENYECLVRNIERHRCASIIVYCAGLSDVPGKVSLDLVPDNTGAGQTRPGTDFVVMPLDDCGIVDVDLIWLDVNGTEAKILEGGRDTIAASRPVIIVEDGEQSRRYGLERFAATRWLQAHGYRRVGTVGPDTKFMPEERC